MKPSASQLCVLAGVGLLALSAQSLATGFTEMDLDTRSRAKVMRERSKQAALLFEADKNAAQGDGSAQQGAECGSQSIGNIDTGGRPGTAPREVFVFAPNAINIVSGRGCK